MLYRNDNIIINDDEVKGTIKDLQIYDKNDVLIVRRHPMGGYTIEGGAE